MNDSIEILSAHVAKTLPDSISERRKVLTALSRVLKASHKAYRPVLDQIAALDSLEQLQANLPLQFTGGAK